MARVFFDTGVICSCLQLAAGFFYFFDVIKKGSQWQVMAVFLVFLGIKKGG